MRGIALDKLRKRPHSPLAIATGPKLGPSSEQIFGNSIGGDFCRNRIIRSRTPALKRRRYRRHGQRARTRYAQQALHTRKCS